MSVDRYEPVVEHPGVPEFWSLPDGYRGRAATLSDVAAIQQLVAECERQLYGRADTDVDVIAAELARPGLDLDSDTVLVYDQVGELVGRAWVNRRSAADVHPGHRGRGLGAALLAWIEARAIQVGAVQVTQTVPDEDRAAVALLRSRGFETYVTSWLLGMATATEPVVPEPPAGVTVRAFRAGDESAAHHVTQDAFDDWQQRRHAYDEWARHTVDRTTFVPEASPVAFAGDQIVGAVISLDVPDTDEGYVESVAVHRGHRNRGIARLLLRHAFRAFHQRGKRSCTLWTHSDTGALPLYERVGMTVQRSSTVFRKKLTDAQ